MYGVTATSRCSGLAVLVLWRIGITTVAVGATDSAIHVVDAVLGAFSLSQPATGCGGCRFLAVAANYSATVLDDPTLTVGIRNRVHALLSRHKDLRGWFEFCCDLDLIVSVNKT